MFAKFDLTWSPNAGQDTPPTGKGPAIVRNDTYSHTFRVTDGVTNGLDAWTWDAQIRLRRLQAGDTPGSPLASFVVTLENEVADLLVHVGLSSSTTTAMKLPVGAFWDLQLESAGVVATWLSGAVKILDDVSRS